MSCEDIPSLLDLQKVKKHAEDFGRLMGTGTGTSTNEVTGQVRPTYNKVIEGIGIPVIGNFTDGCTVIQSNQGVQVIGGSVYRWSGALPKYVPPSSSPEATGGISPAGDWVDVGDASLRSTFGESDGSSLIGFKQAAIDYTGPVQRTVANKLFDVVSVKDFGAVGDGVTDDSAAFLKAILYVLHIDVGGAAYPNKVFGKTIFVPAGTYEIKSKVAATLGYSMAFSIEGESELTTFISVNNPNGFLDLTMTSRAASLTVSNMTLLAKYGTASSQPGVGRDNLPVTLADVHDIPSGVGIKMTFPAGILTAKTKSLKMTDVIMTGWNRTRGDYFSEGVSLVGGRNPTLTRVVIEGKYGYLLTGKPDTLYSAGTAFKMVDSYSPTLEDCYCNHYVRGFDLTSSSSDPAFSTSEGGNIVRSAFDAMYGIRVAMPSIGGEPGFNIIKCHLNFTRLGIDFQGKNQVVIDGCLSYCEADVPGTTARDIYLKGTQKSVVVNNTFAKTNADNRYCITFAKWGSQPVTSCVVNNNMYWAGATGAFRCYNIAGVGAASNITIGDGECHEDVTNLFTANGEYTAINPMRIYSNASPEGVIWAPLGSLCVARSTGAMYKKSSNISSSNGWTLIP